LIYDSDRNMVRVEQRPFKQQGPFFVSDPLITINDYNIGVSFNLNRNLKNCSIGMSCISYYINLYWQGKHLNI